MSKEYDVNDSNNVIAMERNENHNDGTNEVLVVNDSNTEHYYDHENNDVTNMNGTALNPPLLDGGDNNDNNNNYSG
jgi:hypothetical protein